MPRRRGARLGAGALLCSRCRPWGRVGAAALGSLPPAAAEYSNSRVGCPAARRWTSSTSWACSTPASTTAWPRCAWCRRACATPRCSTRPVRARRCSAPACGDWRSAASVHHSTFWFIGVDVLLAVAPFSLLLHQTCSVSRALHARPYGLLPWADAAGLCTTRAHCRAWCRARAPDARHAAGRQGACRSRRRRCTRRTCCWCAGASGRSRCCTTTCYSVRRPPGRRAGQKDAPQLLCSPATVGVACAPAPLHPGAILLLSGRCRRCRH